MYAIESLALRVSIVLCMVAAVVTILYFTPLPEKAAKSCDRPCQENDWPMICRYKFTIQTFLKDSSCDNCFQNTTECDPKCLTVEGKPRGFLAINQQLPGPPIQVCRNDVIIVEITNKLPSQSIAIHFRGQKQEDSPYMDGTPMVTQCPINSYTTFQYKFRAVTAGTHFYSAYSPSLVADGVFGGLIVREDNRFDLNHKLYDVDDENHLILISEWSKSFATDLMDAPDVPDKILINGKYSESQTPVFHILKGKRYRFRMAYTGGVTGCPVSMNVENHLLKVITLDGHSINPYEVDTIVLNKGERVDFVLKAKHELSDYRIHVKSHCFDDLKGNAIIRYDGYAEKGDIRKDVLDTNIKREFNTGFCQSTIGKVCIGDLHSQRKMPNSLSQMDVEKQILISYNYVLFAKNSEDPSVYNKKKLYTANNITFLYPPSPLLTQYRDIPDTIVCNSEEKPSKCDNEEVCECVHIENVPLGATTELILIDQGGDTSEHVFHLHGYHFYVVAVKKFDEPMTVEKVKKLDDLGILFKRNLNNPPLKDTVRIPRYGSAVIRFLANNPGYWMLRDENAGLWTKGMDVLLKVGQTRNFPSPPSSFPTCGSWVGPEFYLG
ncbi:multi-copper oxidase [Holotrichia oblita]|uniref:Multi-copper oxidase n=1 Tax=Holotrichia oblita TaxID=644536 RepID=A0ACB9T2L3_HOLOL|nr:multi-copper oxidase [Holotrichia oblita]